MGPGNRTIDNLWREGLDDLVGQAEAPDRVWEQISRQVQAGPPRPQHRSRGFSWGWRMAGQFAALAGVFLFVLTFRAEMIRQGNADILTWRQQPPAHVVLALPGEPLAMGVEDTLSQYDQFKARRAIRTLKALNYPSMDPVLWARPASSLPTREVVDALLLQPGQDQVLLHRRERENTAREKVLSAFLLPRDDPMLARPSR